MKKRTKRPMVIMEVTWVDAMTLYTDEKHAERHATPRITYTVGYLFRENRHFLVLCCPIDDDGPRNGYYHCIPKGMIRRKRRLR